MLFWAIASVVLSAMVGAIWGGYQVNRYWASKAGDMYGRTPVCWGERMYYVVPEAEFNRLAQARQELQFVLQTRSAEREAQGATRGVDLSA